MVAENRDALSLTLRALEFAWAKEVVDRIRGVHPELERRFDEVLAQRPG